MELFETETNRLYLPGTKTGKRQPADAGDMGSDRNDLKPSTADEDGCVDFQAVSDWWEKIQQEYNIKNRRIRMDKENEDRGNG